MPLIRSRSPGSTRPSASMRPATRPAGTARSRAPPPDACWNSAYDSRSERKSTPLTHGENIPFAIFEPGRLRTASGRDAVHGLDPRHVVLLEHHASRLEFSDFGHDVVNGPERRTRLRRACPR